VAGALPARWEPQAGASLVVATVDVYVLRGTGDHQALLLLRRAAGTRCTGSWEVVHGRIEPHERPEDAAVREVREETGFAVERLYNVTVQPFYIHAQALVTAAVVFAAFVGDGPVVLGPEHDAGEWLLLGEARERVSWPRSRTVIADIALTLRAGHAGPIDDVMRVF
jgi:8-oxo-dGTP pyrophosphatase MutT (NUDIX family)